MIQLSIFTYQFFPLLVITAFTEIGFSFTLLSLPSEVPVHRGNHKFNDRRASVCVRKTLH